MTATKQPYSHPVAALMELGDVRGEKEWRDYLALGLTDADVPELCCMALDEDLHWADEDSNEVWSGVHAWRALAQLKAESALPALIELLGRVDDYDDDWISDDLPRVFAHIGPATLTPLRDFLADTEQGHWSRLTGATALVHLAQRHPNLRSDCIAVLSQQLEKYTQQDANFNGLLVGCLVDLNAVEAAPVMEQAFAANQVDLMLQGDWEEVQIQLGLLAERITPPPDYRALMAEQMGFDPSDMLDQLKDVAQAGSAEQARADQQKAERKAADKAKAKARAKRKQAKKSRKKQRKRK
jgi:hypothetical protein